MKIFFDTEFTGLHKDTTLISLGMVDENGRSFYAEFTDYDESQCDEWIKENVIANLKAINNKLPNDPNITIVTGDKNYIKIKLSLWLAKYTSVELVSDVCHYDMVLFIDIFGSAWDVPKNVNPACHDINQDIAKYTGFSEIDAFDLYREGILEKEGITIEGDKHNALYDALVIKEIYNLIFSK